MKQPLHDIELIERYFDNALSPEESQEVAQRLKRDYDFRKLFDTEKLLVDTIRLEAAKRDLDYLRELERSFSGKNNTPGHRIAYYLATAAAITAVILFVWMPTNDANPGSLFAEYFQPQPNIFEPLRRDESGNSPRRQAFQAYEQENYQRAALLFTQLLTEDEDPGMMMLLGNCNLVLGETDAAKANFLNVIRTSAELTPAAKWYLALSHLRSGESDRTRSLLQEVSTTESPYAAKANILLDELE